MRAVLLVNPRARRHGVSPRLLVDLRRTASGRARVVATESLEMLDEAARSLAKDSTELVVLSGGDGTHMAGLTAVARAFHAAGERPLPRFALLPAGTVSTVASNWGSRGDPMKLLDRALDPGCPSTTRPTLRVRSTNRDGTRATTEERLGFIFGTGLVARFFDLYYAAGARGLGTAAQLTARIFLSSLHGGALARTVLTPLPCSLEVDGVRLAPEAWSLVTAAVVRDLGLHMLVTHRAGESLHNPHLVASPLGPTQLGPRAFRVLAGRPIGGAGAFDDLFTSFTLRFPGGAPGPFVLDGDVFRANEVTVSAGPPIEVLALG